MISSRVEVIDEGNSCWMKIENVYLDNVNLKDLILEHQAWVATNGGKGSRLVLMM